MLRDLRHGIGRELVRRQGGRGDGRSGRQAKKKRELLEQPTNEGLKVNQADVSSQELCRKLSTFPQERRRGTAPRAGGGPKRPSEMTTANLRTNIMDFRGLDSEIILS